MKHRNRNMLAALLAAGLLVLSAFGSTALAHGGPGGGPGFGGHDPGSSPKPHPSVAPTQKAKPSHDVKVTGPGWHLPSPIDCSKISAPSGSPAPTAASTGAVSDNVNPHFKPADTFILELSKIADSWGRNFDGTVRAQLCSVQAIQTSADKEIASQVKMLGNLAVRVGKITGLSSADQAILTGEINGLTGDLNALKAKIDAETTLAGAQADLVTLSNDSVYARSIGYQVRLIACAESAIAQGTKLGTLATTLAGQIAAAPSGIDTAAAQTYLTDMNTQVASAAALVGPLPASLLALTPAQLQAGKGDPTLAKAGADLWQASFDLWKAGSDGRIITWILAGKPAYDGGHQKSPACSPTPAPVSSPI